MVHLSRFNHIQRLKRVFTTAVIAAIIVIILFPLQNEISLTTAFAQYGGGGNSFTTSKSSINVLSGQNPSVTISSIYGIEQVMIEFKRNVETFPLSISEIDKPTNIPIPPGKVMQYYRIAVPQYINTLLVRAEIHLNIPKEDVMGIDTDTITLYRFNEVDSKWQALPTIKVGENSNFVRYIATTNSFSFFALTGEVEKVVEQPPFPAPFISRFKLEGFDVPITLTNGNVDDVNLNIDGASLEIMLSDLTKDAELTIEIPRGLLDALNPDGSDTEFTVMFDGKFADYTEEKDDDKRVLKINVPEGTAMITILGTFVVPEFGTTAIMMLVIAIIGVIITRHKGKFSFN